MTDFRNMLGFCGLSISEAADYLKVRPDTVKSWASGRRYPPDPVLAAVGWLRERMHTAANGGAGMADLPKGSQDRVAALALGKVPNSRSVQGDAPSLVSVVADEMVARDWTSLDVAVTMEGDYRINIQNVELAMMAPPDRCAMSGKFIDALDGAFGRPPGYFKTIHQRWLDSPKGVTGGGKCVIVRVS